MDLRRTKGLPKLTRDVVDYFPPQGFRGFVAFAQHGEAHHLLPLHLMWRTDRRGLHHAGMADEGPLHLAWPHALSSNLEGVVRPSVEEPIAVLIHCGPVPMVPDIVKGGPVSLQISLWVPPKALGHAWCGAPSHEISLLLTNAVALIIHHVHVHAQGGSPA